MIITKAMTVTSIFLEKIIKQISEQISPHLAYDAFWHYVTAKTNKGYKVSLRKR